MSLLSRNSYQISQKIKCVRACMRACVSACVRGCVGACLPSSVRAYVHACVLAPFVFVSTLEFDFQGLIGILSS